MAAATATDSSLSQDRRLAIKSSAKISKSASLKKPASATAPPRPIPKIVNADPSSFRRVVQELTGSPCPSPDPPPSSRPSPPPPPAPPEPRPSRLQRIAPPPLRPDCRSAQVQQAELQQPNQHHQFLVQHHRLQQQHSSMMLAPPPLMASLSPSSYQHNPLSPLFQAPFLIGATNLSASGSLPMLPPHLLSPLPALTPGDNTWASPLDVIPPLAPPSFTAPNPALANRDCGTSTGTEVHRASAPNPQLGALLPLHMPISPAARFSWPPSMPWSPRFAPSSLPPISPSFFPPSPGFGLGNIFNTLGPNGSSMNFGTPHGISFQGSCDNGIFKPA